MVLLTSIHSSQTMPSLTTGLTKYILYTVCACMHLRTHECECKGTSTLN